EAVDVADAAAPRSSGRDVMQRLVRIPGARSLVSARAAGGFAGSLQTELRDGAPPRVAPRASPDAWIEIRDEALPPGPGEWVDGARVFPGADDLVLIPGASRLEDLRLLHAPRDAAEIRQHLRVGPAITRLELDEGRLLARDAGGTVRLAADAPFAIDATGKRRVGVVTLAPEGDDQLLTIRWSLEGCAFPVVLDPAWSTVPSMKRVRYEHGAVRMRSGRVLVVGGRDALDGYHSQAEVYDPIANAWTLLAGGGQVINPATAVADDGKVVVEGWPTSQVYDPATNVWTETADASKARAEPIAVPIAPSKVLIAGGQQTSVFSSAEILDTTTLVRTPTVATMTAARAGFGAVRLSDGRVLLAGGVGATSDLSTAEIFDPATGAFTATGSMTAARRLLTLLRLPSGKVLAVDATSADLFDPATGTWSAAGTFARHDRGAYLLDGGWALTVGGPSFAPKTLTDAWDPVSNAWYSAGSMAVARTGHAGVALADGTVLVTGGRDPEPTSTAEVFSRLFDGATCAGRGECRSGFCADGRCCSSACTGPCQACDTPSAPGTCTSVSGAPKHGDCGAYATCAAGACSATCATSGDCAATHRCVASACVPKLTNGAACAAASDCTSGFCVDGVCCNRACSAQCESCAETGGVGTCANRIGAPIGGRPACASGDPACGPRCDGTIATHCVPAWDGAPCSENKCVDGVESHYSVCDGKGLCKDVKKACGAYACGGFKCNTSCALTVECAAGFVCTDGKCVAASGLGKSCLGPDTCASGFCTDGVCCGVASCGEGKSCATPAARGRCAKLNGQTCAADAECGSGACADGVCCESRCGGQCEACDVAGFLGECRPIKGAPRAGRPACVAGTDVCSATSCDGVRVDECAAFAREDTECRAQSCADGLATRPARCDGKGACPAVLTSPCNGYGCDPTTKDCRTTCAADADCFGDFRCLESKCVRRGARCSPDGTALVSADGVSASCSPYVCASDACRTKCGTTGDCQAGFVCDPGSLACVAPAGATEDSGGGCAVGRTAGGPLPWLAALSALGLARRSRERRRTAMRR
ncbi:MAG: hypothetical protein HYV09_21280, partial [Deltaproteobacteria bacterium]|nr:hypothetical protein [Deltaproteobacteria bacterium]